MAKKLPEAQEATKLQERVDLHTSPGRPHDQAGAHRLSLSSVPSQAWAQASWAKLCAPALEILKAELSLFCEMG